MITHDTQSFTDVISYFVARNGDHGRMANSVVFEHRNVCRTAADVDQRHTNFLFVFMQDSKGGSKRFEHDVRDFVP